MKVRAATIDECNLFYQWRVQDEQAEWWEGKAATPESHRHWFMQRFFSPSVILLVGEIGDRFPVGQARIDSNGELSFSIDEAYRGQGYGTQLVKAATAAAYQAGHTRVKASADQTNQVGIKTMLKAGFRLRPDVVFLRHPE